MDERAILGRLRAYDHWANGETLASIERAAKPSPRALGLMSHVLATEAGWLRRMGLDAGFSGFWPADDVAGLRQIRDEVLPARLAAFLADANLSDLRASGAEPASTDFIHATRTGVVP